MSVTTPPLAPAAPGRDAAADMRQSLRSPMLDFDAQRAQRLEASDDPAVRFRLHGREWRMPIGSDLDVEVMDAASQLQEASKLGEVIALLLGPDQYAELRKAAAQAGSAVALRVSEAEAIVDAWGRASGVGGLGESAASPTS